MSDDQAASEQDMSAEATPDPEPQPPFLKVLTPDATPEEVAALVAVFASLGGGDEAPTPRRPEWNTPHRLVRASYPSGPGGWRSSGLPR